MSSQDWKGLSSLFGVLSFILLIACIATYFYQETYVTFLGVIYRYPYRGYTLGLAFATAFFFIAAAVAESVGKEKATTSITMLPSSSVVKRYCNNCGSEVSFSDSYCPKCGKPLG